MTAGILPARRVRRAPPLPNSVRVSATRRTSDTAALLHSLTLLGVRGASDAGRAPTIGTASMTDARPCKRIPRRGNPSPYPLGRAAPNEGRPAWTVSIRAMPMPAPTRAVRVRVPAKVNLHLGVGGPLRPDGYHELVTVFQAVDLLRRGHGVRGRGPADRGHRRRTRTRCPTGSSNLAWQAAVLLAQHGARRRRRSGCEIAKSIPVAGGMAGGSADAAATLLGCAALWDSGTVRAELSMLAARARQRRRVPAARRHGAGHRPRRADLTPALTAGDLPLGASRSPPSASRRATPTPNSTDCAQAGAAPTRSAAPDALLDALRAGDARRLAAHLGNDLRGGRGLARPVAAPHAAPPASISARSPAMVSGSGPTCAFLCADADGATALAAALMAEDVCRTDPGRDRPGRPARAWWA